MITFIIPTINRPTLERAVNSLMSQTNQNWKAIIIFDGVESKRYSDSRINSIQILKKGKLNHAGQVRNEAIKYCNTEWVAFLDDDDTISNNYVEKFCEEIKENPDADCIIFRMKTNFDHEKILPPAHHKNFVKNKVGISFAIKKEINLLFEPSSTEDFNLLDKIRSSNKKIIISPYITYFVREAPCDVPVLNRVRINY